jgi:YesN/AraC family two-component response regulator
MGYKMSQIKTLDNLTFIQSRNFGKAHCEPSWNWCPPPLADFDLWYALAGTGNMQINGHSFPIQKGSCFLIQPGDRPAATQDPKDRLQVVYIHFQCTSEDNTLVSSEELPQRYTTITETYHFEMLLNRILELEERNAMWKDDEFNFIMKQLCIQLYRQQSMEEQKLGTTGKHGQLILRVISHVKDAPGYRISNQELAAKVDLSPEYLNKIFKRHMGISLKQYITNARLERALYLLQETSMNVTQVAEALGYANVYFFSKQFKKRHGHPPSHFR